MTDKVTFMHPTPDQPVCDTLARQGRASRNTGIVIPKTMGGQDYRKSYMPPGAQAGKRGQERTAEIYLDTIKVTHNTCSLHLVSNFQNSSKHTKPSMENRTSLW